MKITKIERQKKNSERYSLYVDGEFWMGVHENVLIQFGLFKTQEIAQSTLNEIIKAEYQQSVYLRAINFLSFGLKTKKEVSDYLAKFLADKGKEDEIENPDIDERYIFQTLDKLIKQNYLNDLFYAQSYIRTQATINYKGPDLIRRELLKKGVEPEQIDEAMKEYPQTTELENATFLVDKYKRIKKQYPPKKLLEKTREMLNQKGFSRDIIQQVVGEMDLSDSEDSQEQLLEKEAEKQYKKWVRKHDGYQLKQKIIESLMRKGFDYDAIQAWLRENSELLEKE